MLEQVDRRHQKADEIEGEKHDHDQVEVDEFWFHEEIIFRRVFWSNKTVEFAHIGKESIAWLNEVH